MQLNKLGKWVTVFFLSASIFVSVILVEAVVLTLIEQFKVLFVSLSLIPAFILAIFFSIQIKKDARLLPKITAPVLLLILLISFILIFFPHDTFGGRDESIYANLASNLVNNSYFKIPSYLNNLHDHLAEGVRIWPKGYSIWLGIQEIFFGSRWMLQSNVILTILGLCSFFITSSYLGGSKIALAATALFSSSMPFLWFSRETMSENLSFFLLWSIILFLLFFLKTKKLIYLISVFVFSWLFGLTRFEGFLLQFVVLLILPFIFYFKKINIKKALIVIAINILLLASNIFIAKDVFLPSFLNNVLPAIAKGIKKDISSFTSNRLVEKNISYSISDVSKNSVLNKMPFFIFQMMAKYNFILIIFSIFFVAFQFLSRIKKLEKSKKFFFIILFLLLPEYYKLIDPNVTLDQPWLYRRYMYALLPLGYLCFCLFLSQLKNKRIIIFLISNLFLINIFLVKDIIFLKNNWFLVNKVEEITKNLSQNDLVIIKERPLGYYSVASFLVINKGARSTPSSILRLQNFFPEEKIFNGVAYKKLFLLSKNDEDGIPSFKNVSRESVDVEYPQLIPSCKLYLLGDIEGLINAYDSSKISLSSANKYCSQPKNEIINYKEKLYLYELIYEDSKINDS